MNQNLSNLFSYLKIDWSEHDHIHFRNHHIAEDYFELEDIQVEGMRCSPNGELCIHVQAPDLLGPHQLILLEEKFEKLFNISQVIFKQDTKANNKVVQEKFIEQVASWLKKHANKNNSLEGSLFAKGNLEKHKESIVWLMESDHYALISNKTDHWLNEFWYEYGCFPCEIALKTNNEQTDEDLIESAGKLLSEANAAASELYQAKVKHLNELEKNQVKTSPPKVNSNKFRRKHRLSDDVLWGRTGPEIPLIKISDINHETDRAHFEGQVFMFETKITRNNRLLVKFAITDLTTSISCTIFANPEEEDELTKIIKNNYLKITADVYYDDRYAKDFVAKVTCIESTIKPQGRNDRAKEKRVELHIHSKLSAKDGTINPKDIVKTASDFGHKAIAITDHGVVQAFPEIAEVADELASKGRPIKIIYGVEGYLLDDGFDTFAFKVEGIDLYGDFIIFDLQTTGSNPKDDKIKSIKAIKLSYDELHAKEMIQQLQDHKSLDDEDIDHPNLSGLLDLSSYEVVSSFQKNFGLDDQSQLDGAREFSDFCGSSLLVAEDALNKLNFLRYAGFKVVDNNPRIKFNPPLIELDKMEQFIDIDGLAKISQPKESQNKLRISMLAELLDSDFEVLKSSASKYIDLLKKANINQLNDLNNFTDYKSFEELKRERKNTNHILLLVQDPLGLYNLYRLCSAAHLDYFYYSPRIPRSLLTYYGIGIIKGMACVDGEIFQKIYHIYNDNQGNFEKAKASLNDTNLIRMAERYDFLEIQPRTNNNFLIGKPDNYINSIEDVENLNKLIIELSKITGQLVCATGDVHFLNPEDDIYRKILMTNMNFDDMEEMAALYFRTTDEMLDEFSYLGPDLAYEFVIKNTNAIADLVEDHIRPFPQGSYPPLIQSADHDVRELTMENAMKLYGYQDKLPEIVEARIKRELSSIIDNGFANMYYISHAVVKKSNDDGFIVGSRGSVGSSLVATLCGITEVNPLQPHYVCPKCKYSEFDDSGNYGSGFDLPAKKCPKCGADYIREGQDIPFETFLGFYGDKQPDIDLNFSGFYQSRAHQFIEDMFGAKQTFRAGTISSYAEKNSAGMVLNYFEENEKHVSQTEVSRLAQGLQGVKVTTGQHPGGMVVIPKERDIFDFTPIQYPANKKESGVITTHFDFNSLHDTILKLDILGHDDPSMLKMLGDITGIDVTTIPIPDEKVMSLFHSTEALGIPDEESTINSATIGLPELGTFLVRNMISETKPKQFYDLVQISGLSHGTDVWTGNAQDLIRDGICTINEVIGCRDSIMTYLIYRGLPNKASFDIMEKVRKGRGLSPEDEKLMRENDVPEWYIDSCKKIKYMFPKAHAVAYLISALRIAWFKVYYPEAYYCAYFTIRANEFSSDELCLPPHEIKYNRAEQRKNWNQLTSQQQKRYFYLELVEEMQARGIDFLPFDITKCEANEFYSPESGKIRPPFNAIPNISDTLARQIVKAREVGDFKTREELARRAELGPVAMEALAGTGMLDGMPESAQIDLFSLL